MSSTAFCEQCGAGVGIEAAFCGECGSPQPPVPGTGLEGRGAADGWGREIGHYPLVEGRCGRCGTPQPSSRPHCWECGLALQPTAEETPAASKTEVLWREHNDQEIAVWDAATDESRHRRAQARAGDPTFFPVVGPLRKRCPACDEEASQLAKACRFCGHTFEPSGVAGAMAVGPLAQLGNASSAIAPAAIAEPASRLIPSAGQATTGPGGQSSSVSFAHAYTICAIREVASEPQQLVDEGLVFPVPLDQSDTIAIEDRDGERIRRAYCNAIEIAAVGSNKSLTRVRDVRALVTLTDARITIACSKFDKGGGWRGWSIGGALMSVPLNITSHALASRRRRGKMLVGQVRFPWIDGVYAQSRVGFGGSEKLRVVANAGGANRLRVDLTFPKDVDAAAIGTELIRRAASFRLVHDDQGFSDDERRHVTELGNVAPLVYEKGSGKMAGHQFPTCWPPSECSARYGLVPKGRLR